MKAPKKITKSYLQRRRNEKRRQQEFCLNGKKSSKQSSVVVSPLTRDSQFAIVLLSASQRVEKNFEETVYK